MTSFTDLNPQDLLSVTRALVDFPSVSLQEEPLCDALAQWCSELRPDARQTRINNSLIIQVGDHDAQAPFIFAGHIDTVPPAEYEGESNAISRIVGGRLYGLGTSDMKSGIAMMIALLESVDHASTFIFYEAEEIADKYNGLRLIEERRPDLLVGQWAILLEPTNGGLEMGCQGAITVRATYNGQRAHSARPWMGENAIHKAANLLDRAVKESQAQPYIEVEGLTYTSTLQVTKLTAGIAANVIPDRCDVTLNHRYTPNIPPDDAQAYIRNICLDADDIEVISNAAGAMPAFDHPIVARARQEGRTIVPKVAWTDVARFYALGVPAVNCGPGDATLCHRADEHIEIAKLDETYQFMKDFLRTL